MAPESVTNKQLLAAFGAIAVLATSGAGWVFSAWAGHVQKTIEENQADIRKLEKTVTEQTISLDYIVKGIDKIQASQNRFRTSIEKMNTDGTSALRNHRHD